MKKQILYIDLDGVVVDYYKAAADLTEEQKKEKGFFENMLPLNDSIESVKILMSLYDVYFLSTAPWENVHSWTEKRIWVEKYFGKLIEKKLILSHNKGLLKGDYIIDDHTYRGVSEFDGTHIHFGTEKFKNWNSVLEFLIKK